MLRKLQKRHDVSRVLSWVVIYLGVTLPQRSSEVQFNGKTSYHALLATGRVYLAAHVTTGTGELLPHRFTLTEIK